MVNRLLVSLAGLAVASSAWSVPVVLIAPVSLGPDAAPTEWALGNYLAQQMEEDGRVSSIVWGMADPVFREAVYKNRIQSPPDFPTVDLAHNAARTLKADYVFLFTTKKDGGRLIARGELHQGGRRIWTDTRTMVAQTGGGFDLDSTLGSVARTWALLLNSGPFKAFPPKPKVATPETDPGQAPVPKEVPPAPRPKVTDNAQLQKDVAALLTAGSAGRAIVLVRDAVDSEPLDPERRLILIKLLSDGGDAAAAATEAHRAAEVIPDHPEIRMAAVRAYLESGQGDRARDELNETLARDPNNPEVRLLVAEAQLSAGNAAAALPPLDGLVKDRPSSSVYFLRALARTMLGGTDGAALDLAEAKKQGGTSPESGFALVVRVMGGAFSKASADGLMLCQRISVKPTDPTAREDLENAVRLAEARSAFLKAYAPPAGMRPIYERSLLAQKLLALALINLQTFVKDGTAEELTDARINLGEAIKQNAAAKEAMARNASKPINVGNS